MQRTFQKVRKSVFGGRAPSELDFKDAGQFYPLPEGQDEQQQQVSVPAVPKQPQHLQRNKAERLRLQGLMRNPEKTNSVLSFDSALTIQSRSLTLRQRYKIWMVNEGSRRIFVAMFILLHLLIFSFGFVNYQVKDNLTQARRNFGITYPIARSAAFTLHFEVAFILLPICRNFISLLRRTPIGSVIPFDKNITFHKLCGWSIVIFSAIHIIAHMVNFARLAIETKTGIVGFIGANFLTGPGATGWVMALALGVMAWFAMEKRRRSHFERFWYSHHLFIVFFAVWQMHGMFCMIKPDAPPFCAGIAVFWKYWLVGGAIFIFERVLREVRSRHKTYISKVIQHPSKVVEIQIKKEKTTTRTGQYIFLNCPEISYFQWHPFTLTSAPEEDYISVHIRMVGDFTLALGEALGCDVKAKSAGLTDLKEEEEKRNQTFVVNPPVNRVLPRIMVDGPFGSASEDWYKFETIMLCGAGIGITPFASILKSIWYRVNYNREAKPTRLQKIYFFWICRDYDAFEWFASLLAAIEEQDLQNFVEIHTYLTAKLKDGELNNIYVSDVGNERDAITRLRSPTHYGRPNWDKIFATVRDKHPSTDVGVMFCGPRVLGSQLHEKCTKWTSPEEEGTHFIWGKENF